MWQEHTKACVEKMWHVSVSSCAQVCACFYFAVLLFLKTPLFPGTQRRFAADLSGEIFKGDIVLSIDGKPLRGQPMEFAKQLSIGTASNPET